MTMNYLNKHLISLVILPAIISIGLLFSRVIYAQSFFFTFLAWNLFLALIPFFISLKLIKLSQNSARKKRVIWLLMCVFLLFLPNAPYLVTDLIHLRIRTEVPYWFDILMIASFSWNGLILGFLSIYNVHEVIKKEKGKLVSWSIILLMIVLCGFGIYLGRYLRWNSWDIIANPLDLFQDILNRIIHPFLHVRTWGITFSYSSFLLVGYLTIRSLINIKPSIKSSN